MHTELITIPLLASTVSDVKKSTFAGRACFVYDSVFCYLLDQVMRAVLGGAGFHGPGGVYTTSFSTQKQTFGHRFGLPQSLPFYMQTMKTHTQTGDF